MPKSASTTFGFRQTVIMGELKLGCGNLGEHALSDAVSGRDFERLIGQVVHQDADLAAIPTVDGARRVLDDERGLC